MVAELQWSTQLFEVSTVAESSVCSGESSNSTFKTMVQQLIMF
uniref:Uncharacterized protein n=1 Tax=Arundo donax TaxID=35708 RepID=A0A0A8Z7F8_ARUDO